MTENNLLQYSDLNAKVNEINAAFDSAADALKTAESRLSDLSVLIKHLTVYRQTKAAYDGIKTAQDKPDYRRRNESAIILHQAAKRALAPAAHGGKLPNLSALKADYYALKTRKTVLRTEYTALKKQAHEYGIIKANVDNILRKPEKRKSRDMEI